MKKFLPKLFFINLKELKLLFVSLIFFFGFMSLSAQTLEEWKVNPGNFAHEGDVYAQIIVDGNNVSESGTLAAFVNGECRGVAKSYDTPFGYVFTIRVYSNQQSGESINFKYNPDGTDEIIDLKVESNSSQFLPFSENMIIGSAHNPEILSGFSASSAGWGVNVNDFEFDGTITSSVTIDGNLVQGGGILAAFINGECRGYAYGYQSPWGYVFTIRIYSNQSQGEQINFKFLDPITQEVVDLDYTHTFTHNMVDGSAMQPIALNGTSSSGLSNDASLSDLRVSGNTVNNFDPQTLTYIVELPYGTTQVPNVAATTNHQNASVQINDATSVPGITTIEVTAENQVATRIYSIEFRYVENQAPVLTEIGDQATDEDTTLDLELTFTDDANETEFLVQVESDNEFVMVIGPSLKSTSHTYQYSLKPAPNWNGTAQILVRVADERGGQDVETYTLTVNPINDAPVLTKIGAQTTKEETDLILSVDFIDPDESDTHTLSVVSSKTEVEVIGPSTNEPGSEYTLRPTTGFSGTAEITVTVTDNSGEANNSDTETYTLTISNDNDAPIIEDIADQQMDEDTEAVVTVNFTDEDTEDSHTISATSSNENVLITNITGHVSGSSFTLDPVDNWFGDAIITVTVKDAIGATDEVQFNLTVNPINDAPILTMVGDQVTDEDVPKQMTLNFTDADETDQHTVLINSDTPEVSIQNNDLKASYTDSYTLSPQPNWHGEANITVSINDNSGEANSTVTETYKITVNAVNDTPVLYGLQDQYMLEDNKHQLAITFEDNDMPNDTFTVEITSDNPNVVVEDLQGHTTGSTYYLTPAKDYVGEATITEKVTDASGASAMNTFKAIVQPVNDPPVITNIPGQTIIEGETFASFSLDDFVSDVDNTKEELQWTYTGNTDLVVSIVRNQVTITAPEENWSGSETLSFTVTDPDGLKASDIATFTVTFFNDVPVITDIPDQMLNEGDEFTPVNLDDFIQDEETPDEGIQWSFTGNTQLNVQIDQNRVLTVTAPFEDWNGQETITLFAMDEGGKVVNDQVVFALAAVNDVPVLEPLQPIQILEDTPVPWVNLNEIVEDETPVHEILWTAKTKPAEFDVIIEGGIAKMSINTPNWFGEATIIFEATDADGGKATVAQVITVVPVNDQPIVSDIPGQIIEEGATFTLINLNEYVDDPDHADLELNWVASPSQVLNVLIDEGNIATIEIIDPEWNGSEKITFFVSDGQGGTASDFAVFEVTPVNDSPIVSQIPPMSTDEGGQFTPFDLTQYVEDIETPDNRIKWTATAPTSLKGSAQNLIVNIYSNVLAEVIIKDPNWYGTEIIRFVATDEQGASDYTDVEFTVNPVNDAPEIIAEPKDQTIQEDGTFDEINLTATVTDDETEPESISWTYSGNNNLVVELSSSLKITSSEPDYAKITPVDENWTGSETITFIGEDEGGLTAQFDVKFTITPVNDVPEVEQQIENQSINEGDSFTSFDLKSYFQDVETADADFDWKVSAEQPNKASQSGAIEVSVSEEGIVNITITDENWNGEEWYKFTAIDEGGLEVSSTASFEVLPVNDDPEVVAPMGSKNKSENFGEFLIDLTSVFKDVDNGVLEYTLTNIDPEGIVNAEIFEGSKLKITSIENQSGTVSITVTADDESTQKASVQDILTLTVTSTNDAPQVATAMGTVDKNEDFEDFIIDLSTVFSDADGEDLTYEITETTGSSITAEIVGNILTVSAVANDASDGNTVSVIANDGYGESATDVLTVNVAAVNDAPAITAQQNLETNEDTPFELLLSHLTVDDPDNTYPDDFTLLITGGDNYSVNGSNIVPAENYHGTLSVPVMVNDGELSSSLFKVLIEVVSVNDQPVISPIGNQLMDEDGQIKLSVEFTDGDVNDTHTLSVTSDKSELSFEYDAAIDQSVGGSFVIIPDENWGGEATITVTVTDNSGANNNAGTDEFVLIVKNVNDKPVIVTQSVPEATQEEAYTATLNFEDIDSETLDVTLQSAPDWLSPELIGVKLAVAVVNNQASINLTGTPGPTARDYALVVKVSDGVDYTIAQYELIVNQINYKPEVKSQSFDLPEDASKQMALYGSDNETPDNLLVFAITTPPSHGNLTLVAGTNNVYKYVPAPDFFGADFFEYSVTDADIQTSTARIDLNVLSVNDAPEIETDKNEYATAQNQAFDIIVTANDDIDEENAAQLQLEVVSDVVNGSLVASKTTGTYTYTPNTGFYGNDKVTFRAIETDQNPNLASNNITRLIKVERTNEAPVTYPRTQTVDEDNQIKFNLFASDDHTDILNLEYQIVQYPQHALTLTLDKNSLTYQAEQDYNGTDQLTFKVMDENGAWSNVSTVDIVINPINDKPIVKDFELDAAGTSSIMVDFAELITDVDTPFEQLSIEFTNEAAGGTAGLFGGTMTQVEGLLYQFDQSTDINAQEADIIVFKVVDGNVKSLTGVGEITNLSTGNTVKVLPNLIAVSSTNNVNFGETVLIEFLGIDLADPKEELDITITVQPTNGTLSTLQRVSYENGITKYSAIYTPTTNNDVADVFTYSVSDGSESVTANITVNISKTNVAPDLTDIADVQMTEDDPTVITIPFSDPDTDVANLTWTFTATPAVSGLVLQEQNVTGSPASIQVTLPQNYTGSTNIEVELEDNTALSDIIDFTLTVNNVNDAPVLDPIADQNASEDTQFNLTVTADDVDTDNANLTYSAVCVPANAATSITFTGNNMAFVPAPDYHGDVTVTVTVDDNEAQAETDTESFTLSIANVNDDPVLPSITDPAAIDEDAGSFEIDITPTDIDTNDDLVVSVESSNTSLFPTASMNVDIVSDKTGVERKLTLTPAENVFGTSVITVTVDDGEATAIRQFNVTVNEVNDKPVIEQIAEITIEENQNKQVPIIASDVDSPTLSYDVQSNNVDVIASLINNGGSYELRVEASNNYNGTSQVTVTVDDNEGGVTQQIVDVNVTEVDQIPYVMNPLADVNANEDDNDEVISIGNIFDDPDNDNTQIQLSLDENSNQALLSASINGTDLTLDFLDNQFGTANITIKGVSNGKTVYDVFTVNVAAVDDAPEVLNPIDDVEVDMNDADFNIDLTTVFTDIDNEDTQITKVVLSNTNTSLVGTSINANTLTLAFATGQHGTADITIEATSNGKTITDEFNVIVNDKTAIGDDEEDEMFIVYPNPNNGEFALKYISNEYEKVLVKVYDLTGKVVYLREFETNGEELYQPINIRSFGSGIYIIQIQTETFESLTQKIIVQ